MVKVLDEVRIPIPLKHRYKVKGRDKLPGAIFESVVFECACKTELAIEVPTLRKILVEGDKLLTEVNWSNWSCLVKFDG